MNMTPADIRALKPVDLHESFAKGSADARRKVLAALSFNMSPHMLIGPYLDLLNDCKPVELAYLVKDWGPSKKYRLASEMYAAKEAINDVTHEGFYDTLFNLVWDDDDTEELQSVSTNHKYKRVSTVEDFGSMIEPDVGLVATMLNDTQWNIIVKSWTLSQISHTKTLWDALSESDRSLFVSSLGDILDARYEEFVNGQDS